MAYFVEVKIDSDQICLLNLDNVLRIVKYTTNYRVYFVDGSVIDIKENFHELVNAANGKVPKFS
jgi:hypothetical protein